jgi:hypothetical protein
MPNSLEILIRKTQEESPFYQGLLYDVDVKLVGVTVKFMPNSINNMIKIFRTTKLKPTLQEFVKEEKNQT